jgi:hypothetical protein
MNILYELNESIKYVAKNIYYLKLNNIFFYFVMILLLKMECIVCYETQETIDEHLKHSFIVLPCEGTRKNNDKHTLCFTCFMRNETATCPMCRFNYKNIDRPITPRIDIDIDSSVDYQSTNENINSIDRNWINYKQHFTQYMILVKALIFDKNRNNYNYIFNYENFKESVISIYHCPDNVIDITDDDDVCKRMYLTNILDVAYKIDTRHNGFTIQSLVSLLIKAVNDYIYHEISIM